MQPHRRLCVVETPDPSRCWPDGSLKMFGPNGQVINEPCDPTFRLGEHSHPSAGPITARHSLPASPRHWQSPASSPPTSSWAPQAVEGQNSASSPPTSSWAPLAVEGQGPPPLQAGQGPPPLPASEGPPPLPASSYSRRPARVLFRRQEDIILFNITPMCSLLLLCRIVCIAYFSVFR